MAESSVEQSKRTVRFVEDETLCSYYAGATIEELDVNRGDIWYQNTDMSHMKRKALVVAKEAQRYGLGSLLTNTYGKTCTETQEAINTWVRNGNSRRGLERWINDEYAAKRADIRRRTIQSVLRAQAKMRDEGVVDADYSMKVIARLSEAFSIDSRNFAVALGKADAEALKGDEDAHKVCLPGKPLLVSRTPSPRSVTAAPRLPQRRHMVISRGAEDMRHFY